MGCLNNIGKSAAAKDLNSVAAYALLFVIWDSDAINSTASIFILAYF
jgi:hypothetical protein